MNPPTAAPSAAPVRPILRATVNGLAVERETDSATTLLDFLREDLDLTGAKKGCDIGTCGSCAVIVDGKAVLSCIVKAKDVKPGAAIQTVEGLASEDGTLHPLQTGFMQCHGFQCGICTSGFLMSAKVLLDRNPKPKIDEIHRAINKNICRCTGYEQLVESILVASGQMTVEESRARHLRIARVEDPEVEEYPWGRMDLKVVGKSQDQVWARSRVTGEAKYTADIKVPGAVWATTVRSPHPHARLLSIRTDEAAAAPGVLRVLTWRDVPGENRYGKKIRDQQVFAREKVRCVGEPVALVVAEDRARAEAAARLVHVEYEVLPPVFEPEDAMAEGAPAIHEKGNVLFRYHLEKGDVERGFAEADVVLERRYTTQPQDHSPIEPEACVSYYDAETGKLTVLSPGQSVFFDRLNIIRALGLPKEDVRCIQPAIGAAYGKREDIYAQIHCALATFVTGRPCRMEYTREETLQVTSKRTQQRTILKIGVKRDGTITALEGRVVGDAGAYASWSVNIMRKAGVLVAGPYRIPNVRIDSYAVYTNNPLTGATRGFGAAETNFCSESLYDEAAAAIEMDPMEFRLRNCLEKNSRTATDHLFDFYVPVADTIREAAKDFEWERLRSGPREVSPGVFRGFGVAGMWYGIGFGAGIEDTTDCIVEIHDNGTATIRVGTVDYGNQSNTTFSMMAAEVLGLRLDQMRIINADSDETHNCGSTVATKQTYTTGNAVVNACLPVRRDIQSIAARLLGADESDIDMGLGEMWVKSDPSRRLSSQGVFSRFREMGKPRRREGLFHHHRLTGPLDPVTGKGKPWYPMAMGCQMAEVEVNTKTGRVKVVRIVASHYLGRSINPVAVRGQIVGGVSMGVGMALYEDCDYQNGVVKSDNFDTYQLMRASNYPEVISIAVERDEKTAPFGAIGIGEPPTIPTAAAIANAVHDAVGVRVRKLPITPKRLLAELQSARAS